MGAETTDQDRFMVVIWPLLPLVLRTAGYLTRDTQLAEDLAQETMMKAYRAIDTFRPGTDARAWVLTILRHAHHDALRARQRQVSTTSLESDVAAEHDAAPASHPPVNQAEAQALMERIDDQQLVDALRALPEEIRWTLLLTQVEQMELAQAAQVLDVPVGTIKSRLHRGRALLRTALSAPHHPAARQAKVAP